MRTCVGCRTTLPIDRLTRCVLAPGGVVISRTAPGRGAWLCSAACIAPAIRKRGFERAWRRPIPDGALADLPNAFESTHQNMEHWSVAGTGSGSPTPTKG
ncbi:MAG: YlxR family protein [Ilumatobacteraceae bacterium]|jgi:predicted RNA-binding protein YlxR (DUF448 family)